MKLPKFNIKNIERDRTFATFLSIGLLVLSFVILIFILCVLVSPWFFITFPILAISRLIYVATRE